jgi:hypothetical protein
VTAEAHIGQPPVASTSQAHDQGKMVKRRPEPPIAIDACGDPHHMGAKGLQQQRKGAVELIAEATSPPRYDLADQVARR